MYGGIVTEKQKKDLFMGKSLNCNSGTTEKHGSLLTSMYVYTHTHTVSMTGYRTSSHPSLSNDIINNNSLRGMCECLPMSEEWTPLAVESTITGFLCMGWGVDPCLS